MLSRLKVTALAMALAGGLAPSAVAQAATVFGSAGIATVRPCAESASQACILPPSVHRLEDGGLNQGVSTSFNLGNGSSSMVSVGFGEAYLPLIKGAVTSSGDQRTGSNVFGFRTYTYTGAESIDLALSGNLHFVSSGDLLAGEMAGEGQLNAHLFIARTDFLDGVNTTSNITQIFECGFGQRLGCDNWLVEGSASSFGLAAGEYNLPIALAAVRLNPGDRFVVGAGMQMQGNRGGSINALNTFTVELDEERSFLAGSSTPMDMRTLVDSIASPVPEPSSWMMMIAGFGLTGALVRRRRGARAIA